ncbi:ATP-grasp domain-containing protein [Micromonospora mirobrigensis]|uniref:ATP-grasp domain-containing protein n=1 Tax=Micromonospora mirobrigensis TaxID=262898 RepID=A0A1C4V0Z4_9ACTN|nr:hypothetical protein [Micromonospora mirobrigensis]SCE77517.1 ATP-grasp domain-containing protein [Micromonospora mirobrigensis]
MRTDIVVQDVASFRIDPALLARPDRRLALITSPANLDRLRRRNRQDVFAHIVVPERFDTAGLTEAVTTIRAGLDPAERDDIRLLCHDEYSLGTVAQVRADLGIPGDLPHNVRPFVDKLAMKAALRDAGVRLPRHVAWDAEACRTDPEAYLDGIVDRVGLPAFVKPTNESGSVGTRRIDTRADLAEWAAQRLGDDTPGGWEIDEFVTGTLYHLDTLVEDGRILHVGVNENLYPCYDYIAGKLSCSFTLPEEDPAYEPLLAFNRRVLDALPDKPARGVFHHEVFRLPDGELVFLEIAARAPAALIPFTSQIRYGVNVEEALFRLQRGEQVAVPTRRGPYAAYVYFPKPGGRVVDRTALDLSSDHRWTWNAEVGEVTAAATDIRDFAASVLLWNDDIEELRKDLYRLDKHQPLRTTAA